MQTITAEAAARGRSAKVLIARAQAIAYVWGRQDAGESSRDTGFSLEFGNAFADRVEAFENERTHFCPSIGDAFIEWRDTHTIA